jgi:hypothetical protein
MLLASGPAAHAGQSLPPSPGPTVASGRFAAWIAEASQRFGLPAAWISEVLRVESGGEALAVSPKGAMGLMQLMPRTWADLRSRYDLGDDPFDTHDNIVAGAAYLHELHDRYGEPGFLAAYNAGPARYEAALATGRPLPAETIAFLARIEAGMQESHPTLTPGRSWATAPLFVGRPPIRSRDGLNAPDPMSAAPDRTFAVGGLFAGVSARRPGP